MRKITLLFGTLFMLAVAAQAQQREQTLLGSPEVRLSGIWGSFDHSYAYFSDDFAYARGGSIGIEISRSLIVAYAGNEFRQYPVVGNSGDRFDLQYDGLLLGYTPNSYRAIHPRFNLFGGSGRARLGESEHDNVFVLKPSVGIELNTTQWFRVGLEAGYRFIAYDDFDRAAGADLSSPFVNIALRLGLSWGK